MCLIFKNAFDKVLYARLFPKLKSHGDVIEIGSWIKDWPDARKEREESDVEILEFFSVH